jgi:catechol 2,3-dioxygenase-like lactoylglutathione lyase family enzyme
MEQTEVQAALAASLFQTLSPSHASVQPWLAAKEAYLTAHVLQGPHGNLFALVPSDTGRDSRGCQPRGEEAALDGLAFVTYPCPEGSASDVAYFYASVFGANTTVQNSCCYVQLGDAAHQQQLVFIETSVDTIPSYDGHHFALYVSDETVFHDSFDRLDSQGLIFVNPRFSDAVTTRAAADECGQYRLLKVVDRLGATIVELEHEVRSPKHAANPFSR